VADRISILLFAPQYRFDHLDDCLLRSLLCFDRQMQRRAFSGIPKLRQNIYYSQIVVVGRMIDDDGCKLASTTLSTTARNVPKSQLYAACSICRKVSRSRRICAFFSSAESDGAMIPHSLLQHEEMRYWSGTTVGRYVGNNPALCRHDLSRRSRRPANLFDHGRHAAALGLCGSFVRDAE
jgi:hypothetical protein